jgi:hypothetical protein
MYRAEASRAESPKLRAFADQRVSALEKAVADAERRAAKPSSGP